MKALLSHCAGGPESLELGELPEPQPAPGQVRVRVQACALGFPDLLLIQDQYQVRPPRPFAPGGEVAGTVEAVGAGVNGLSPGDRVIGLCFWGGMAQQVVLDAKQCIPVPEDVALDDAAALVLSHVTAYYALRDRGRLRLGDVLLVTGAAGGVGQAAVELGKAWGARVVAAASSVEKLDDAFACGADAGVVYPSGVIGKDAAKALGQSLKQALGSDGANVVLDVVGGEVAEPCLRQMAWDGRYLVVGFAGGVPKLPANLVLLRGCQVVGVSTGEWMARNRAGFMAAVRELVDMCSRGMVRPRISRRLSLAQGAEALGLLARREARGKVLVTME
ncbi:MAG: NADPH:quinone oxidoreductase family protein [Ramlibacter sp.]